MSRSSRFILISSLIVCSLVVASVAQATVIHSDVMGATVTYTNISEGSPTGDSEPLYGQPGVVGDTLVFPNITSDFAATSVDGGASDQTDGKLNFMIEAKAGYTIDSFNLVESGLVTLRAPFGGNTDAFAEVIGFAVIKVVAPVSLPPINAFMTTSPLGGQYLLSSIGGISYASDWTGTLSVPLPNGTTKANIVLNNNLFAATLGTGTSALIDKKAFEIDLETTLIPEPSTAVLGLISLIGLSLSPFHRKSLA